MLCTTLFTRLYRTHADCHVLLPFLEDIVAENLNQAAALASDAPYSPADKNMIFQERVCMNELNLELLPLAFSSIPSQWLQL